jgi:hypothetical protein
LTPLKVNTLFAEIASEIELSEELVSDIVTFYWKGIKQELEEPNNISFRIDCFGTFEIRKQQVIYMIDKYERILKFMKPTTYSRHVLMDLTIKKLDRLKKLLKSCEQQELKKKQVREIQKNGKTV